MPDPAVGPEAQAQPDPRDEEIRRLKAALELIRDNDPPSKQSPLFYQLQYIAQEALAAKPEAEGQRYHPHYTSTYCIHGDHANCRLKCKTCGAACLCACHAAPAAVKAKGEA